MSDLAGADCDDHSADVNGHTRRLCRTKLHPKTAARDLRRGLRRRSSMKLEPYMVPLPFKDSSGCYAEHNVPMVLPHEAVHHLYEKDPKTFVDRFFGTDGSPEVFWSQASKTMPHLTRHPGYAAALRDPQHSIPVRIHGDEVAYNKRGSKLMCCNVCSALTTSVPMTLAKILVFAVRTAFLLSFDPLLEILAWSFGVLLSGTMPALDHNGCAFESGSRRSLAGKKWRGPTCSFYANWLATGNFWWRRYH